LANVSCTRSSASAGFRVHTDPGCLQLIQVRQHVVVLDTLLLCSRGFRDRPTPRDHWMPRQGLPAVSREDTSPALIGWRDRGPNPESGAL